MTSKIIPKTGPNREITPQKMTKVITSKKYKSTKDAQPGKKGKTVNGKKTNQNSPRKQVEEKVVNS